METDGSPPATLHGTSGCRRWRWNRWNANTDNSKVRSESSFSTKRHQSSGFSSAMEAVALLCKCVSVLVAGRLKGVKREEVVVVSRSQGWSTKTLEPPCVHLHTHRHGHGQRYAYLHTHTHSHIPLGHVAGHPALLRLFFKTHLDAPLTRHRAELLPSSLLNLHLHCLM